MHDARIAALEERLHILDVKEAQGHDPTAIARDRAATTTELAHLRGIRQRNAHLVAEAPALAAATDAATERRRQRRERAQLTPGSRIPAPEEKQSVS